MWKGAQYTQAQQIVEQAYSEHFEPFEGSLSEHGVNTLELEYGFSRLGWHMQQPPRNQSDVEALVALVTSLKVDVDTALSELPLAEPPASSHNGVVVTDGE